MSTNPSASGVAAMPLAGLLMLGLSACAGVEPVFPPLEAPIVWPDSGDPARFCYVGRIHGEADLKKPRSFWAWLGDLVGGEETPATLQSPSAVVVTPSNVLYVTDTGTGVVHRFDLESREYAALNDAGEGRAFEMPIGLALFEGRPLVVDRSLGTLTLLAPDGSVEDVFGRGVLEAPVGVAVGPGSGRLFVVDVGTHQVKILARDGALLETIGGRGAGPGEFNYPTYIACDSLENIFVSDTLNFRIQVFDSTGSFVRAWGRKGDAPGEFSQPKGIAVDPRGLVYVVDSQFENVQIFDALGQLLLAIGEEGRGPGQFWLPTGVYVDHRDRLWVGDWYNQRVQVFRYVGEETAGADI